MNAFHWRREPSQQDQIKRGRPRLYDDEERKQRHRQAALAWHHANKRKKEKAA